MCGIFRKSNNDKNIARFIKLEVPRSESKSLVPKISLN